MQHFAAKLFASVLQSGAYLVCFTFFSCIEVDKFFVSWFTTP